MKLKGFQIIEKGIAKTSLEELIAKATEEVTRYAKYYKLVNESDRQSYETLLATAQTLSANSTDDFELLDAYNNLNTA